MQRFKNILCVVEPGDASRPVLERAVNLALNNQAGLTVAGVVPHLKRGTELPRDGSSLADLQSATVKDRTRLLEAMVEPHTGRLEIRTKVLQGVPFLEIVREVLRHGRDLAITTPVTLEK